MATLREIAPGQYEVRAVYTSPAAASAGWRRLIDGPVERAFKPLPPALEAGPAIDAPEGIIPASVAAAFQRDAVPADDDEGEPIPGYRCASGACAGD